MPADSPSPAERLATIWQDFVQAIRGIHRELFGIQTEMSKHEAEQEIESIKNKINQL
jgi:hypothetical protein